MSDIDFEELDKAVNNLVGKDEEESSVPTSTPVPEETSQKQGPQVSQKPRGRFMDVLHPSSDMTSKDSLPTARKTVNPITSTPAPAVRDTQMSSNHDLPAVKNDWPDPIDMPPAQDADTQPVENIDIGTEAVDDTEKPDAASLFLPGAKVEKRPLGGFNAEPLEDSEPSEKPSQPTPFEPVTSKKSEPLPASLPPELEANLVAIEEGGFRAETPAPEVVEEVPGIAEEDTIRPNLATPSPPVEKPTQPAFTSPPDTAVKTSGFLAAGSIPQQYKTSEVNAQSEATHPIFFDADHHDASLPQGAHKKQGSTTAFQWIFIIVGLLLLGATLGAALFVFVSSK